MAARSIRTEDLAGLTLAVLAHVGLVAWLAWMPRPAMPPLPERVSVTLVGEVGEQASAPGREAAAAAVAPVISPDPVPEPAPAPVQKPLPQPLPRVTPPPVARVVPTPPARMPGPAPAKQAAPKPNQPKVGSDFLKGVPASKARSAARAGGASRIGEDFLSGVPGADSRGKSQTPAGPTISAQVRTSLQAEVSRQLKPHWQQPDGVDVDKLATTLEWDLNPDGTLAGPPRVVSQTGVNSANRTQAERHKEQAVRAVRLTRFTLPQQLYAGWQHMRFTFDWKLN